RRWPPDFISPGPRINFGPRSRVRAIAASEDSRTSSARARVRAPSSAFGQRLYSASPATRPTTASPRNSSRSLCGNPALRWVIACASRSWSAKACPAKRTGPGSGAIAHVGQRLVGVELADDVEVADQRLADFVIDRHVPAHALLAPLQLDVLGLHVGRVADVQAAEEQVLDPARVAVGDARLGLQALECLPHRVVLGV